MSYEEINERIDFLLDSAARLPKSQSSEAREELAQYGFDSAAVAAYREELGISEPEEPDGPVELRLSMKHKRIPNDFRSLRRKNGADT